ncbi:MAG: anaerobic ribonucleoside-triphosphate reductase activating protein [Planctomycetota bacterium]|jgi:pyruvate formate lyase activating enzyme
MEIKGFIRSSLLEWEGKIASVLFVPGCNLRCRYCHAGHLIHHPERLESLSREQVLDYMRAQGEWLDGAVITGGEPTLHGEELLELIDEIRAVPLDVMVETNGTRPEWVGRLVTGGYVQAMSMDVKAPLTREDYERVAGVEVDVKDIAHSLQIIRQSGLPYELRITLVPGLVGRDELERMVGDLRGAKQVALQNFKPDLCIHEPLRQVTPYSVEELETFRQILAPAVERVVVRGQDHAAIAASKPH